MRVIDTPLVDIKIIEPVIFEDARGFFFESFNQSRFEAAIGRRVDFVQSNHSRSRIGVVRGMHYQVAPHAQAKLIRVARGAAYDVAVDLRCGSSTFGQWTGTLLSAENRRQLWIPEGFAHGFMAVADDTEVLYQTTGLWVRDAERAIAWDDPALGIRWPEVGSPLLSDKDAAAARFGTLERLKTQICVK